ncbi:hydroxymethylglutaryl-CoA lyase [Bacillus sp. HMF5848]|uniref:hydroxymethylglutaryl-CoA lyase n=1 Tax=Bacillus sp. HMF5848 TaxID=2495421 RepID=UPI000F76F75E|nr:hydroxymethylglutaryl-CoA lyase [Bacillus sp. HMF5848]RSK26266.1 hydroxymethylglutaryl-CoA lyase [Bacillus sp. HMF5848]
MNLPATVEIKEVGPRDGLQNESKSVSTEDKIQLINHLSQSGLKYIEVTSFVNPKWIPQLADASEVASRIERIEGVTYAALVPNERGLQRALQTGIDEISVFLSASETHNRKNINKSIEDTLPILKNVIQEAKAAGKTVRGYISTVIECPYEGLVNASQVNRIADVLLEFGVRELSLGDTIGVATPLEVEALLATMCNSIPPSKIAMHFHDTHGTALANILTSMQMGIYKFDSSIGGLGGCPYAPGASGNVATEDVVYMLERMGVSTGVRSEVLTTVTKYLENQVGLRLNSCHSQIFRAGGEG